MDTIKKTGAKVHFNDIVMVISGDVIEFRTGVNNMDIKNVYEKKQPEWVRKYYETYDKWKGLNTSQFKI